MRRLRDALEAEGQTPEESRRRANTLRSALYKRIKTDSDARQQIIVARSYRRLPVQYDAYKKYV